MSKADGGAADDTTALLSDTIAADEPPNAVFLTDASTCVGINNGTNTGVIRRRPAEVFDSCCSSLVLSDVAPTIPSYGDSTADAPDIL